MVPDRFPCVDLSIVVPVRGEEKDLPLLHTEIAEALNPLGIEWEIVYVDDGAQNGTPRILAELARRVPQVQVVTLDQHYGQSHALIAGVEAAFGDWVAILDGDDQNDPADLPTMWETVSLHVADGATDTRGATGILPRKVARSLFRRGSGWLRPTSQAGNDSGAYLAIPILR
jgi:dolichol-phosphate mannosyltransferase